MLNIVSITCNPFQENSYLIYDEEKRAIVIDPGMYSEVEQAEFESIIEEEGLTLCAHILTHAHLDHVFGCSFIEKTYGLKPQIHEGDMNNYNNAPMQGQMFGVEVGHLPEIENYLKEGDKVELGDHILEVMEVPGHAPGHIAFIDHKQKLVFSGDVLFYDSIGRYDLPGANLDDLLSSIKDKLLQLPDDYRVYPGHGPTTTIGREKRENALLKQINLI